MRVEYGWGRSLRKSAISLKLGKIDQGYYWWPIGNRIRAFDWCQNQRPWMSLKGHYALSFKTRASFGAHLENLNEDRLLCQRRRCSAMTLDSGNIRFVRIFAVVLKISVNFPDLCLRPYITYTRTSRFFRYQVELLLFTIVIYQWLQRRLVKCELTEMWQGKRISETWSAEYLESAEYCGSFVDATSSESYNK